MNAHYFNNLAAYLHMADGKIVQCIGAVVDLEFLRNAMPKVYGALKMVGSELTFEVQQQLGDGIVRTIALGAGHGRRGTDRRCSDSGCERRASKIA